MKYPYHAATTQRYLVVMVIGEVKLFPIDIEHHEYHEIASFLRVEKEIEIRIQSKSFAGEKFRSITYFDPIFNPKKRAYCMFQCSENILQSKS